MSSTIAENNAEKVSEYLLCTICKDLIRKMLVLDPSERASLDDVMKHDWVKSMSEKKIESRRRSRTASHCGG